jgi:hypothetical protein
MKKSTILLALALIGMIFSAGCLQVEKKQYKLKLTGANSGTGTIKFVNIVSQMEDNKDVTMKDFASLITDYMQGDELLNKYPGIKIKDRKLFEENGLLCGEFSFEFDSLETFKLYKYDESSPFMLIMDSFGSDNYQSSNGDYGKISANIVFWKKGTKEFSWETKSYIDTATTRSMMENFRSWKKGK